MPHTSSAYGKSGKSNNSSSLDSKALLYYYKCMCINILLVDDKPFFCNTSSNIVEYSCLLSEIQPQAQPRVAAQILTSHSENLTCKFLLYHQLVDIRVFMGSSERKGKKHSPLEVTIY